MISKIPSDAIEAGNLLLSRKSTRKIGALRKYFLAVKVFSSFVLSSLFLISNYLLIRFFPTYFLPFLISYERQCHLMLYVVIPRLLTHGYSFLPLLVRNASLKIFASENLPETFCFIILSSFCQYL